LWFVWIQKSTQYRVEGDKALIGKEGNFGVLKLEIGKWKRKKKRRYPLPLFFI